jgi:uncharacterized membrane protein
MKTILSRISRFVTRFKYYEYLPLVFSLGIFGVLTSKAITASSIWFDEAFSAYLVRFNFWDIAKFTATDVHPPFYYWLLKVWTSIFGSGEIGLRSLSIVLGMMVIIAGFIFVRKFFGRKAAWLSTIIMAVSPMLVRYGIEARMYMLVTLIAFIATYVLYTAVQTKRRKWWMIYAGLVALGMYTHYFSAIVWLGHFVWLWSVYKPKWKTLFKADWAKSYLWAVLFFVPWLPFMVYQLGGIQGGGFWIGPISGNSLTNLVANVFFYREHEQTAGLWGAVLVILTSLLVWWVVRTYRSLGKTQKSVYGLILSTSVLPVAILFIASIPPLRSSFVERYLIPSIAMMAVLMAVTIVYTPKIRNIWKVIVSLAIIGSMLVGVSYVYYMGNYNKNSTTDIKTRDLVKLADERSQPGVPIIAESPWTFYEAVNYTTKDHPVWFIDEKTNYNVGSLDMLKHDDTFKIKDINAFVKDHQFVWYLGYFNTDEVDSPYASWTKVEEFTMTSKIDGATNYKAALFKTR